ncbi:MULTISPECIES: MFS transporter [Dehalobacter]|uniref:MFS transporter n=2 Tax=Dehalobacter restrictus TaxID=55583 RepID=A0A857DH32_9FIRM|nr:MULTISPECIES: MFS transporter [Dehalobacter]AHF10038.1 MFS transporter [Dehalobacter restrictus DSM 9455]MCG1025122.1 MFS transporter [Dehalobacter sp.]OCZ52482.1 MFS transporter [Dehalobacter sp. TeCB1]QHA00640.1 MFS transporter [Dehalobacter restrictus]
MNKSNTKKSFVLVMILYLLGIFMGAIDTGIVTPARTVIQNNLLVDEKTGIWMITIYTLAYAASIPIMGKLADMFGRKYIYLASIFLFGLGSLFCGLAQEFNSFTVLLAARIVQALGGGGILPVATAEFGTTFPPEKRGMALGLVGGVYGIANIFGASAGSAILDIFGKSNWQFIFYVNLPITLFILIAGFLCLPNNRNDNVKKIDIGGILILTVMILALMYGLKNIDFFDFKSTLISTSVYPFLTLFGILIPFFILAEKKAEDPVMNLSYFTNSRIMITFIIAFITGIVLMGMIFVPQFAENSLKIASGSGGYFVIILGLFAGVGAPLSGKLIDKYGPKMILGLGFLISLLGSLFLIFVAADQPSMLMVNISLVLMGLGMGFTMGTPLNYMMLENAKDEESNSALAALSLVRSIGTAIAPAVMVGFLAHAGVAVQNNVMNLLPKEVSMPKLPYAQELTTEINEMKSNPMMKNVLATVDMPNFSYLEKIEINMNSSSDYQIPDELMDKIKSSDVTTITENSKLIAGSFFAGMAPDMISNIQTGIQNGIDELTVVESMPQSSVSFRDTIEKMTVLKDAVPGAFDTAKQNYLAEIDQRSTVIESEFQKTLNSGFKQVYLTVTISSLIGLIFLCFYRRKPVNKQG